LAVTDIKHLIRDPYAVYAKHVLNLRKLGPLVQSPDALSRGITAHDAMERFVRLTLTDPDALNAETLVATARALLQTEVPWPAARALWIARLQRIADWFVTQERARRETACPIGFEERGRLDWPDLSFSLVCRADRIDRSDTGDIRLYDYKTGSVPTAKEQKSFDKQLLIEAAMMEEGAFDSIGVQSVDRAVFIGLGSKTVEVDAPLVEEPAAKVLAELRQLILAYLDPSQGFTARRMMQRDSYGSDYDLLARYGEWDATDPAVAEDLT
jgi:RecB family exonuclease